MDLDSLFESALKGNQKAEQELVDILSVRFRLFARRRIWNEQDLEDVIQDAIVTVLKKYKSAAIKGHFAAWAHTVLHYDILKYYRRQNISRNRLAGGQINADSFSSWQPDPEFGTRLLKCLKEMHKRNKRYARILNLHYQGFTTDEICSRLKITSNTHYITLMRARTMLRACLAKEGIN